MKSQQKVLITGATSGLGLEFAQLAHDAGWQLLLTGRNAKALDELQGKYASARTHIADLSTDELIGSYDEKKGVKYKIDGYLEEFALTKAEADDLIINARNIVFK